jgi:hypothetical protein
VVWALKLATVQVAIDLDIPSDTFDKEIKKRAARFALRGRNPDLLKKVDDEIDAAPTKSEVEAQEQAQAQQQMSAAFNKTITRFDGKIATP